ncbi:MAG: hypothetical protein M3R00_06620, partial [Pseudomonadota bacterium]|nr:hypothetical protein [Pseudomonadota bacterium]
WQGDHASLVGEARGYAVAEFDPAKQQLNAKLELGADIRLNLAQGEYDLGGMGTLQYAVDAASLEAVLRAIASNDRCMTLEAYVELGALGPNACIIVTTNEFSAFGFTGQYEISLRPGVGVKGAIGTGATLDLTQLKFRPYSKLGAYWGEGCEIQNRLNLGIDSEVGQRTADALEKIVN